MVAIVIDSPSLASWTLGQGSVSRAALDRLWEVSAAALSGQSEPWGPSQHLPFNLHKYPHLALQGQGQGPNKGPQISVPSRVEGTSPSPFSLPVLVTSTPPLRATQTLWPGAGLGFSNNSLARFCHD